MHLGMRIGLVPSGNNASLQSTHMPVSHMSADQIHVVLVETQETCNHTTAWQGTVGTAAKGF